MVSVSAQRVRQVAERLKKSERTIWRWVAEGCDLASEGSVRALAEGKRLRRTNVERARERLEALVDSNGSNGSCSRAYDQQRFENLVSSDLPPPGRRGAAAALERLEETEERAHARLLLAMEHGEFYLPTK